MGDLITVSILLGIISGVLFALGTYLATEGEQPGWSITSFIAALMFTILAVYVIEENYKKLPIETIEPAQIDTTITYHNGTKPDTLYTYKFNPKQRLN